jgi:hypothetical protein
MFYLCSNKTDFERAREICTNESNTEPPDERDLRSTELKKMVVVLAALEGKCDDTTASDAFQGLVSRLRSNRLGWIFIVKSLICLDRYASKL